MSKILFVYSRLDAGFQFNLAIHAALSKLPEFYGFPYADETSKTSRFEANSKLLRYVEKTKPDIVLLQYIDCGEVFSETIKLISKTSKVIMWSGDYYCDPCPAYYYAYAPYVHSLFSNYSYIKDFMMRGYKTGFLQHYNQEQYYPIPQLKLFDISFIGSNHKKYPLSSERNKTIEFLKETYKHNFYLRGEFWGGNTSPTSREESNLIYSQSKIGINFSNLSAGMYFSDRLCHIMGSGCFCVSKRFPECDTLFTHGEHIIYFDTLDELKEKCDYYISHNKEREAIAEAGRLKCIKMFGDQNLIDTITKI